MIPDFPDFKPLELSDKKEIESFAKRFQPYSDFDFASMWSWDVKDDMRVSKLNGNLVVRFTDYLSGEPFYSFLGDAEANDTAEKLLALSVEQGHASKLRLIPEEVAKHLDAGKFAIVEDRDHFDYVYSCKDLAGFLGAPHRNSRRRIKAFTQNKDVTVRELDLSQAADREAVMKLNDLWKENKNLDFDTTNEDQSLSRFLSIVEASPLSMGVFIAGELVACTLNDRNDKYVLSHFAKFDVKYSGSYLYSMKVTAQKLLSEGIEYMNCEQDMGILGLRAFKESLCPAFYLKKYVVTPKN